MSLDVYNHARHMKCLSFGRGTSAYTIARLKRDAPEFAKRLAAGEFRSARAAALAAGIRKPPDPVRLRRSPATTFAANAGASRLKAAERVGRGGRP